MDELANLLRQRLSVIGDHTFRDRDPDGHLEELKRVSEAIVAKHHLLRDDGKLTPRLEHFLSNSSFDKALLLIDEKLS